MKKWIILVLLAVTCALASSFCAGFRQGYKDGYCYGKNFCLAPIPPLCPIPAIGEQGYSDGYQRGFVLGMHNQ